MVETQINLFDAAVLSVIGLSALLSFFRGFVREVLSLGAWIGASVITVYSFPTVAASISPHVSNKIAGAGLAAIVTFIGALIVISIINAMILKFIKKGSEVGLLDNFLGLVFGFARGFLLLALAFYVMMLVLTEEDYPEWIQTAQTKNFIQGGAKMIASVAPDYVQELVKKKDGDKDDSAEENDSASDETPAGEQGYNWENVQEFERLIDQSADGAITEDLSPPEGNQ